MARFGVRAAGERAERISDLPARLLLAGKLHRKHGWTPGKINFRALDQDCGSRNAHEILALKEAVLNFATELRDQIRGIGQRPNKRMRFETKKKV